ncbi:MAG: hypothetical protein DDT20_00854 [Firmicutes bacterium]|nr:hypothetical protein [Bacillota bacterium]
MKPMKGVMMRPRKRRFMWEVKPMFMFGVLWGYGWFALAFGPFHLEWEF